LIDDLSMMQTIQAVEVEVGGGPEVLRPVRKPAPSPGGGEVLVRARAIGVSSADMLIRRGVYKWMPPLPAVPGNELAGVVEALGADVRGVGLGQRVLLSSRELPMRGGCYAEVACVPADSLFHLPEQISFDDAVSLPNCQLAGALLHESGIRRPRSIAVYGASGGAGLALLQLAMAEGISCIGIVSTSEKREFVRAAGIPDVVLRDGSLHAAVMELTAGRGVDVVYAHAGPDFIANLDLLSPLGTLMSFSHLGGFMPDADFYAELRSRLGKSLGVRVYAIHTLDADRVTRRRLMGNAIELMAAGRLRPPRPMLFPLSRAGDAHTRMEAGDTRGKVVLVPDGDWAARCEEQ